MENVEVPAPPSEKAHREESKKRIWEKIKCFFGTHRWRPSKKAPGVETCDVCSELRVMRFGDF
jgi:hypothetical protein